MEVGEWYKDLDGKGLYCITKIKENSFWFYGLDVNGNWEDNDWYLIKNCNLIKATKQEIEQALIDEAIRRGFKEGVKFKNMYSHEPKILNGIFVYIKEQNKLMVKDGFCNDYDIFVKGQWAEIIDEKAELKQEIKELEVKLQELREKL